MPIFRDDDIRHIREKVDMLNDWHNSVNERLSGMERDLDWIAWAVKAVIIGVTGAILTQLAASLHLFR